MSSERIERVARGAGRVAAIPVAAALLAALVVAPGTARADVPSASPPATSSPVAAELARANTAAANGEWDAVDAIVGPLLARAPAPADLAEAHRLAGIAAFFQDHRPEAEAHFLAYLRFDLDGQLDPAIYQPEVVVFFQDVRKRHMAELRARRPRAKRYWLLNLIPPGGQIQNGDRGRAILFGSLIGAFAVANITSYIVLRSWCTEVSGDGGPSSTCDSDTTDHAVGAARLRTVNLATGVGLVLTYAIGVYDGFAGYRRHDPRPYVAPVATGGGIVGLVGTF